MLALLRAAGFAAWCALGLPARAQDRIEVVTTTTDLRSLTEAVGGERVAATSLVAPGPMGAAGSNGVTGALGSTLHKLPEKVT